MLDRQTRNEEARQKAKRRAKETFLKKKDKDTVKDTIAPSASLQAPASFNEGMKSLYLQEIERLKQIGINDPGWGDAQRELRRLKRKLGEL